MFEFLFGVLVGTFIVTPTLFIILACSFPFIVCHKKASKGVNPTPPTKASTASPITTTPALFQQLSELLGITQPPQHQRQPLHQQFQQTIPTITNGPVLSNTNQQQLIPLHETARTNAMANLTQLGNNGESLNWFNIIIITLFSSFKSLLQHTDTAIQTQCQQLNIPLLGASDIPSLPSTATQTTSPPMSSGSLTAIHLINRFLMNELPDVPFLGPTRITHLDLRSILPEIQQIKILHSDPTTNTLVFDLQCSFSTDSTVEVDLSVDVQVEDLLVATMPTQVALANLYAALNIRVAVDLDFNNNKGKSSEQLQKEDNNGKNDDESDEESGPSISISLVEPPVIRFDLATSLGYSYWLSNLPFLHSILHKGMMLGCSAVLAPNVHTIMLPTTIKDEFVQAVLQMATKPPSVKV